jgi:DNA-binding IclR family transcriptional regulator
MKKSEERVLLAICANCGPLGVEAIKLSKALDLHQSTVSFAAAALARKGYCTREQVGMRVFWRPTSAAVTLAAHIGATSGQKSSP